MPFICHDDLKALRIYCNPTFWNDSSVEHMFGDALSNSLGIKTLMIHNPEIYELFLFSLYRKPLLNNLRNLTLERMLLFGRAVKLAKHLVTLILRDMRLDPQLTAVITTAASFHHLLFQNLSFGGAYSVWRKL